MGDRINRFLSGKKKYSVWIATFLTSVITMAVSDPGQAQELQEFVPMLSMLISGIAYLVIEGWNDSKRAQAQAAYYTAVAATAPAQEAQTPAAGTTAPAGTAAAQQPFDEAGFIKEIHTAAEELAKRAFPDAPTALISVYKAAEQIGQKMECEDIRQALAYWNYLAGLAEDAWKELEFNNKDTQGCKLHPPQLYEARANLRRVQTALKNLEDMVASGVDWRKGANPTLGLTIYSVGSLAGETLGR